MEFTIIVTVGPSILNRKRIERVISDGNFIFRINGAHGTVEYIQGVISTIRNFVKKPKILIDLPGNKIRTRNIYEPILLKKGESFSLNTSKTTYPDFYRCVKVGDMVLANDSMFRFKIEEVNEKFIKFESFVDGYLESNKGLHVRGIHDNIPFLFEKDQQLINLAINEEVDYLGLSFVRNATDIKEVKRILYEKGSEGIKLISKIEKIEAINNLKEILNEVDYILVDRGDLSSETGMVELPYVQEKIIATAKTYGKKIFLATQFLKNMQDEPIPLISEVMDLYNSIKKGISGIQLSEETAIGKYPEQCIQLIREIQAKISGGRKR